MNNSSTHANRLIEGSIKTNIELSNYEFDSVYTLTNVPNPSLRSITFRACVFKKGFEAISQDIQLQVIFEGCVFHEGILINKTTWSLHAADFRYSDWIFVFRRCDIASFFIYDSIIGANVGKDSPSYLEKIEDSSELRRKAMFNDCTIDDFRTKYCGFGCEIHFNNTTINNLAIRRTNSVSISLWGFKTKEEVLLESVNVLDSIKLSKGEFGAKVIFKKIRVFKDLKIATTKFESSASLEKLKIKNNLILYSIIAKRDFNFNKITSSRFIFDITRECNGKYTIDDVATGQVLLRGVSNALISLYNIKLELLFFDKFYNLSQLGLYDVNFFSQSKLRISNSDLGDTKINNSRLDVVDDVSIENSILTSISVFESSWFREDALTIPTLDLKRRELYRQLKIASDKSSDRFATLDFNALENKYYWKSLPKKWENAGDWFILSTSYWSSKFGQKFTWPIGWIIVFNFIVYSLFVIPCSNKLVIFKGDIDLKLYALEWLENAKMYWQLFLPLRSAGDLGINLSGWSLALYLFHQIVLTYLIYQTISAFRKFYKGSS